MSIIKLENICKNYHLGKNIVVAVRDVNLQIQGGEFLAIAGPSGSGKTTLLNLISGIEKLTSGKVFFEGTELSHLTSNALADIRARKIGFIFQNFNLLPVLTALENVEYPLLLQDKASLNLDRRGFQTPPQGGTRMSRLSMPPSPPKGERAGPAPAKAGVRGLAKQALEQVGLLKFSNHKPMELSGGQRQRAAIARAIVIKPLVVLADEPTANLDHQTGEEILNLMKEINQRQKTTFIFSTHDAKVMGMATRVVKLWDGMIEA